MGCNAFTLSVAYRLNISMSMRNAVCHELRLMRLRVEPFLKQPGLKSNQNRPLHTYHLVVGLFRTNTILLTEQSSAEIVGVKFGGRKCERGQGKQPMGRLFARV
jgi:hypothetical protein